MFFSINGVFPHLEVTHAVCTTPTRHHRCCSFRTAHMYRMSVEAIFSPALQAATKLCQKCDCLATLCRDHKVLNVLRFMSIKNCNFKIYQIFVAELRQFSDTLMS